MKPILFSESSTTFTTNGIGRLSDAISCKVTEERNGQYELEMEYPMTGRHYSDIGIRKIIVAKPSANSTLQAFRIYKIRKLIDGVVTVSAQHISYDLSKNTCMPFTVAAAQSACATTLSRLKSNAVEACLFTFQTDVTTVSSYTQIIPGSIKQRLGGVEGSVLDQFGGEYEWDNFAVILHRDRGIARDITLRYGKNITDLDQEENIANTVTGVVPFWINADGTETVTLTEKVIRSSNASRYSSNLTVPLDMSSEWDETPTEEALRNAARVYVNQSGFGIPKVSIKLSFVNLADTEEYRNILPLQEASLCDTIKVQFETLGIDTTAKVVKTVYDVLKESYESMEIGSLKSTLVSAINDMNAQQVRAIQDTGKRVFAEANTEAQDLINNATAWLTSSGGYVLAVKNNNGSWKELLFLDNSDYQQAHNVLRINENGIGFSRNGIGGPYTQAWTLDGRLVIGGTNVPSITVYDSSNNIIFQATANGVDVNKGAITLKDGNNNVVFAASASGVTINKGSITLKNGNTTVFQASSSGIIWNATNSQMTQDGSLTAKNATLTGGTLELGGSNNGIITMKDSQNRMRGQWNKISFEIYNSSGQTVFSASGGDVTMKGDLHTGSVDIEGDTITFNSDAYIEGRGYANGININSQAVVFSVTDINVTKTRNSTTVYNGKTDSIKANYDFDLDDGMALTGIDNTDRERFIISGSLDIDFGSGSWSWDWSSGITGIDFSTGYFYNSFSRDWDNIGVVNGFVVD